MLKSTLPSVKGVKVLHFSKSSLIDLLIIDSNARGSNTGLLCSGRNLITLAMDWQVASQVVHLSAPDQDLVDS